MTEGERERERKRESVKISHTCSRQVAADMCGWQRERRRKSRQYYILRRTFRKT